MNTLIRSVVNTCQPELTESINVHYQDMKHPDNSFKVTHIDLKRIQYLTILSVMYNRFKKQLHEYFHLYRTLKKFHFQFSDLNESEYIHLYKNLVQIKHCYTTHRKDVGKISTTIRIRLKLDAKLQTQWRTKFPFHYRHKLNN